MAIRFLSTQYIDGSLGIGTANPQDELHLASSLPSIRLEDTDNNIYHRIRGNEAHLVLVADAGNTGGSSSIRFQVDADEKMRITRTGNVGINITPATSVVLDVKEPDASNDLILGLTAGTGSRAQIRSVVQTSTESALSFHTTLSSSTQERFRILNTGAFSLGNSGTNYGTAGQVLTSNGNSAPYWSTPTSGTITGSGTSGRLAKFTGTSSIGDSGISDASNAVAITINGNEEVGIGASPFTKLDVYDSSTSVNIIRARNNTQQIALGVNDASGGAFLFVNTNHALRFGCNGSEVARFTADGTLKFPSAVKTKKIELWSTTTNDYQFYGFGVEGSTLVYSVYDVGDSHVFFAGSSSTSRNELMRIRGDGDVGINHSSPKSKLSIVGDGGVNNYSGVIGIENTDGDPWACITLTDDIDDTSNASNYYLIGRGLSYGSRQMSFHIPTAANYGSGAQPKIIFASTGSDTLFSVEASTGTAYHKGSVGIGTTSPGSKLHVYGTGTVARLQSNSTYVDMLLVSSGNTGFLNLGATGMNFYVNGGSASNLHMHISNAGNVGIGTTSPSHALDVTSAAYDQVQWTRTSGVSGYLYSDSAGVGMYSGSSFSQAGIYLVPNTSMDFRVNGSQRIHINSSGNVGIGTTSPVHNLQLGASGAIAVNSGYDMFSAGAFGVLYRNAYDSYIAGNTQYTASGWLNKYSGTKSTVLGMVDGAFNFEVGSGTTAGGASTLTRIVTMSNSGAVGIGVSAPNAKLEVNGDVSIRGGNGLYFGQSTGNLGSWTTRLFSSGSTQYFNAQTFIFNNVGYGSTEFVRFTSGGRVGVGVTNPSARLQVNFDGDNGSGGLTEYGIAHSSSINGQATIGSWNTGDGYANLNLASSNGTYFWHLSKRPSSASHRLEYFFYESGFYSRFIFTKLGDFHADGDIVAYSTTASDEKLKDNIEPIHNALDKVSKLNGVSFTWNCGSRKDEKDLGVIAQNVEKVLPELVREKESPYHDDQTIKTVDYEKLTAVLIEAVKELQQKIEKLENKNYACKG